MAVAATNIEKMQKLGLVAKPHHITEGDQKLINSLSDSEISALVSMRKKLGDPLLKKIHKGGRFPHPDTSSF